MLSTRVPILMYHDVTSTPAAGFEFYSVSPDAFRAQMRFLAWSGYSTVGLDALAHGEAHASLPSRPVVITFDDGFKSCIENAVPHLKRFGFTATFFIVAGLVGGRSRWLREPLPTDLPLAGWEELRGLIEHGFECGAHSLSHPHLPLLSGQACRAELTESKRVLEDGLAREVPHLAYPYGEYTAEVRAMAQEVGYQTACAVRGGLSGPGDDRFALRRIAVGGGDSLLDFAWRLRTAQYPGPYLRRRARRAWQRIRGTAEDIG
jgi:peptidoglycan/xylan/chitin deacetylase (PgdA/CDA1 family)